MIDVRIPYGENENLAEAYNKALDETKSDWVLFLDHDVLLRTNPKWYQICKSAINQVGNTDPGLITCVTSHRKGRVQNCDLNVPGNSSMGEHLKRAEKEYKKYKDKVIAVDTYKIAGFFMLLKTDIARKIRFRDQGEGINMIDWDYCKKSLEMGHKIYVMKGLYVFHLRNRDVQRKK